MRFLRKLCQKRTFYVFLNRNELFLDQNIEVLNRVKRGHFPKWLVHGFCPKMEIFVIVVFHRDYVRKDRFLILGLWIEKNDSRRKRIEVL